MNNIKDEELFFKPLLGISFYKTHRISLILLKSHSKLQHILSLVSLKWF